MWVLVDVLDNFLSPLEPFDIKRDMKREMWFPNLKSRSMFTALKWHVDWTRGKPIQAKFSFQISLTSSQLSNSEDTESVVREMRSRVQRFSWRIIVLFHMKGEHRFSTQMPWELDLSCVDQYFVPLCGNPLVIGDSRQNSLGCSRGWCDYFRHPCISLSPPFLLVVRT